MSITIDGGMGDPTYAYAELLATLDALRTRVDALTRDRDAAVGMVRLLYDKYEDGIPCHDDADGESGASIGTAIKLDKEDEDSVLAVLERAAPGTTILATPETRATMESLRADLDAATARAEMAVGALKEMVGTHGEKCAVPAQCSALQRALLAIGDAGGGK